jgi:hypothetical protein
MDGVAIQGKIYGGFAKAASRIGLPFDQYRPSGTGNPLAVGNFLATLPAHFRVDDGLKRFSTYDNPLFATYVDGAQVQPGDYLTHATAGTYFIAGMQPLLPILAIQCGRTVTISRPTSATALSALMTAWPASIVRKSARGVDETHLPGNIANPNWEMLLPAVAGVGLDIADVVADDLLRLYFIEQAELSGYGWRCAIKQMPPINGATIYHYAQVVEATGKPITFRRIVSTGGASPALNPVTGTITVSTPAAIGATSVTLTAPVGNWFLEAGDVLTIGSNTVTVAARTVSASGKFTAVPLSTALTQAVTAGEAVSVAWVNDYSVKAAIGRYDATTVDGTLVRVTDARVLMQTTDSLGRTVPQPQSTDKLIVDGVVKSVVCSNAEYAGASVSLYDTQARG